MQPVLLCLHGWGGSKESFTELRAALEGSGIEMLTPDLPGFGEEPEPSQPWNTDQYAEWVTEWVQRQGKQGTPIHLLGHSHGGRIALKIVRGHLLPVSHLYLCASAGIRHARHFKRMFGLMLAKTGKFFLSIPGMKKLEPLGKKILYKLVRVHDYEKASPVMRDTLIRVTGEDLKPILSLITIPTDIFWGTDDGMTPIADAYVMHEELIVNELHVFPGIRHGVHKEKAAEIAAVIKKRMGIA